jgi:hypothetical protein
MLLYSKEAGAVCFFLDVKLIACYYSILYSKKAGDVKINSMLLYSKEAGV